MSLRPPALGTDYYTVTEVPSLGASEEQLQRLQHRYRIAAQYCQDKRVLEVACGPGLGLGSLARGAARVVGGDYSGRLVRMAKGHYRDRLDLVQLDAHQLPFRDDAFDTVILFEALYYLHSLEGFLRECRRILAADGILVLCSVNKEWSDFNPSPYHTVYYSAPELAGLLRANGFEPDVFGAFPTAAHSLSDLTVSLIKRTAVKFHLIPRAMKSKKWLKRIFFGKLVPLPAELDVPPVPGQQLTRLSDQEPDPTYKVLYAIGRPPVNKSSNGRPQSTFEAPSPNFTNGHPDMERLL